ncbi:MAG: HlyD family efflux transporter periplasmic adaptor subunit [Eubacteriales bacterium]|nr:HlyD family efflux transporter periplasmic adaptor subunit [Eubacteriales bacterium]
MKKTQNQTENKKRDRYSDNKKKSTKKLTSRIVIGVTVAIVFISIVFIFVTTNFMGQNNVVTAVTYKDTAHDTISTTGFIIRNEECIKNTSSGVLVYQVSTGDRVAVNGTIAEIYKNESDAVNYRRICDIEDEISELTQLNNAMNSANVGLDTINSRLDQKLISFIEGVNKRDFEKISDYESELLSAIYRKNIITGDQKNFDDKIAQLEEEKTSLENSGSKSNGEIKSKHSGTFVSKVDGYENFISIDDLSKLKYSDVMEPAAKEVNESAYVGKVIKGINWYIACPVTEDEAVAINHNNSTVHIKIPYVSSESIPARVVSINQFSDEEKALAILECNYMNTALTQIRNEAVEIELESFTGLKLDKKALHDDYITKTVTDKNGEESTVQEMVQGVYVKYGDQLVFKQVSILYSGEDFVICDENPDPQLLVNGTTIKLYDEVVLEGDDLFDGKLIN